MPQHPLQAAMDHIEAHPDEWNQATWVCGTVACLAGHIVLQAGAQPEDREEGDEHGEYVTLSGARFNTFNLAVALTHITDAEAQQLFDAWNTMPELRQDTARLTQDLAIDREPEEWLHSHHHCWTDSDGEVIVTAHRRTTFVKDGSLMTVVDHPTRAGAKDYAGDVATCRGLIYTWNQNPPEAPA